MNSKGHFIVSIAKSIIRIIGCVVSIMTQSFIPITFAFLIAECFGILEEAVDKR